MAHLLLLHKETGPEGVTLQSLLSRQLNSRLPVVVVDTSTVASLLQTLEENGVVSAPIASAETGACYTVLDWLDLLVVFLTELGLLNGACRDPRTPGPQFKRLTVRDIITKLSSFSGKRESSAVFAPLLEARGATLARVMKLCFLRRSTDMVNGSALGKELADAGLSPSKRHLPRNLSGPSRMERGPSGKGGEVPSRSATGDSLRQMRRGSADIDCSPPASCEEDEDCFLKPPPNALAKRRGSASVPLKMPAPLKPRSRGQSPSDGDLPPHRAPTGGSGEDPQLDNLLRAAGGSPGSPTDMRRGNTPAALPLVGVVRRPASRSQSEMTGTMTDNMSILSSLGAEYAIGFERLPRRLVLTDQNDRPLRVLSTSDVLNYMAQQPGHHLRDLGSRTAAEYCGDRFMPPRAQVETQLGTACARMCEIGAEALAIVDSEGNLVGNLSASDLRCFKTFREITLAALTDLSRFVAGQGGQRDLITVTPSATLREVLDICVRNGVTRCYVAEDKKLLGVLTHADFLRMFTSSRGSAAHSPVSSPQHPPDGRDAAESGAMSKKSPVHLPSPRDSRSLSPVPLQVEGVPPPGTLPKKHRDPFT
eukprot:Hpha_TRINITY_DN11681_c0_g1::TRINITY_DN11681_c0_g1_i1::g.48950::m.48950